MPRRNGFPDSIWPQDEVRKTPNEWMDILYPDMMILDPDGWDRSNFKEDFARPLTQDEFEGKFIMCTVGKRWPNPKVRFLDSNRQGLWRRGQIGTIQKTVAERPQATADIYLIKLELDGRVVWATSDEVEPFEQLSVFDLIDSSDRR